VTTLISNAMPRALRRERAERTGVRARVWHHWGWLAVGSAIGLSLFGVAAIGTTQPALASRQLVYLAVGLLAAGIVAAQPVRRLERAAWPLFALTVALMVFLLVPHVPEWIVRPRNGARRWINVGFMDLQPSELAKMGYILCMAAWLQAGVQIRRLRGLAATAVLTAVPVLLIMRQPDLDSALLFLPTLLAMLLAAGARTRHIVVALVVAAVLAPASYPFLMPHQRARVDALISQFMGDTRLDNSTGFQSRRAMTLVGAGGVTGTGALAGPLVRFNRLPEEYNDMIFVVAACRWGLAGGLAICGLGLVYGVACMLVALRCGQAFGRLVAVGVGAMVFSQFAVNTGMTLGILPVSGMTLPFISCGGSSLVSLWIMTGAVVCVAFHQPRGFDREALERDP
jgi:cell division protein FtsW (lipid II flippase)